MLETNILSKTPSYDLRCLAKYYYSQGYKIPDITKQLEFFLIRCNPYTNILSWDEVIKKSIRYASKHSLVEVGCVSLNDTELLLCKSQNDSIFRRLLFTLICLAKFGNAVNPQNNNWVCRSDKEIFALANIEMSAKNRHLTLHELEKTGLISFSNKINNLNIKVNCLCDGEPVLVINDFRNLGNQFLRYEGSPCIECATCGAVVKKNSNRMKYCPDCAKEINIQKTIENFKKQYLN